MKNKHWLLLIGTLSTFSLIGCGGSDEKTVTPPVLNSIDINEAKSIELIQVDLNPQSGVVIFSLQDETGTMITGAERYDISYFGFKAPKYEASEAKAWQRWHTVKSYRCESRQECDGQLTANEAGQYQFSATDFQWDSQDPSGVATNVRIAIQIYGNNAVNEVELIGTPSP